MSSVSLKESKLWRFAWVLYFCNLAFCANEIVDCFFWFYDLMICKKLLNVVGLTSFTQFLVGMFYLCENLLIFWRECLLGNWVEFLSFELYNLSTVLLNRLKMKDLGVSSDWTEFWGFFVAKDVYLREREILGSLWKWSVWCINCLKPWDAKNVGSVS